MCTVHTFEGSTTQWRDAIRGISPSFHGDVIKLYKLRQNIIALAVECVGATLNVSKCCHQEITKLIRALNQLVWVYICKQVKF